MSTLSVPLPANLEEAITRLVNAGFAETKAEVVRKAIARLAEEEAVNVVLLSQKEAREGKLLEGDLKKLVKALS
jgi:Arc/MetJ-type ribon-helix-helix transcriptional regulator